MSLILKKQQKGKPLNFKSIDKDVLSRAIDKEMQIFQNSFPIDVFPAEIQDLIIDAKRTKGFNKEYLSAGILSACAAAIGNSTTIYNGSYESKPILWLSIIGRRGTGKTHPLTFAIKPIDQKDNESFIDYKELLNEFEKNEDNKKSKKPKYSKFILKDFTPEKLAESLQYHEKGILIFQDELMRWINSFDQYKKGADQQMYLELYNGGGLTVDRVTKESIRVEQTNVNILGGMQPQLLKGMAKNNRSEDGFLDRFLFVFPEDIQPNFFTGLDIHPQHKDNYKRLIYNLMDAPSQKIIANQSNIDLYKVWQNKKVKECFKDTIEASIQAKLETYVWRLALVIEMIDQAVKSNYNANLKDENLEKAIKLIEYFRGNALRVHNKILNESPLDDLTESQKELYKLLPVEFKRSEVLSLIEANGFKGGSIGRFLKNKKLFKSVDNSGHYKKIIK